ncbi:hypothetical protein H6P81_017854 [Aristolochia fimbriata]|uniref:DUF1308 domain-containing protein n=1 Tax=Aristolochia fimbriata TaxID=158543 RepID=A0AAV7E1C6_ARIFI|nr:hypothetical protein H6P81_017854 [Aristolochia fimbriata]
MERESFGVGESDASSSVPNAQTVERAEKRCQALSDRVHDLPLSRMTNSCKRTLLRLINAELRFLSRLPDSSHATSVNIGYIEAVVHILQQPFITGVSRVCKGVPLSGHYKGSKASSHPKGAHVDIVCTAGRSPVWFLVSDRNPKYISWSGSNRNKGLGIRLKEVVEAAYSTLALKPEFIVLFFSNGIDQFTVRKLKDDFGASEVGREGGDIFEEVEEDWVYITGGIRQLGNFTDTESCREYQGSRVFQIKINCIVNADSLLDINNIDQIVEESKSDFSEITSGASSNDRFSSVISAMRSSSEDFVDADDHLMLDKVLINFDTTALVALVSGISNGDTDRLLRAPDSALKERFKGNVKFIMEQVNSEIQNPLLEVVRDLIRGKCGIISETVHSEFKELVSMYGGPNEKARADALLKRLLIVPDHPSERMMSLPTTRKIALKNKFIFGTGDHWKAPTLTANTGFVRAIFQTGMSLLTLEHSPRALTGD